MSLPEVVYRLRQAAQTLQDRLRVLINRRHAVSLPARVLAPSSGEPAWYGRILPVGLKLDGSPSYQYASRFPRDAEVTVRQAQSILGGQITLFGRTFAYDPFKPNWHRDPISGKEWPLAFWADINVRSAEPYGGVKWIWELNRHRHLVLLAKAHFLTGERQFAEAVWAQIEGWIAANPRYIGVNWASPLELGIRIVNWMWALALLARAGLSRPECEARACSSIREQAKHIERHLSAFSSANNHLIGEAGALALVGLGFADMPEAARWTHKGIRILTREIESQVYPDGVPAEQAFQYLLFDLDWLLLVWTHLERSGIPVPEPWRDRLRAACHFLSSVMDAQGCVPAIGDSDDSRVLQLSCEEQQGSALAVLSTASVLLSDPLLKARGQKWHPMCHWLLGTQGLDAFTRLPETEVRPRSQVYPRGGYAVLRSEEAQVLMDCGPLGYLSTAAHGHADALSVILSIDGEPILVDPGTYAYQEGGAWRDYFRSSRAHNTVVVDGRDQSEMLGTFLWGRHIPVEMVCHSLDGNPEWVLGRHRGYGAIGVTHWRGIFLWQEGALIVVDFLEGDCEIEVEQFWHLSDGLRIEHKEGCLEICASATRVRILEANEVLPERQIVSGEVDPIQGWISHRYGEKGPAPVLCYSGTLRLPAQLAIAIHWGESRIMEANRMLSESVARMQGVISR